MLPVYYHRNDYVRVLIAVHEFAIFRQQILLGVKVNEFSLAGDPSCFPTVRKTLYSLRALLLGVLRHGGGG
jgi:hypothetical protein